MEFNFQRCDNLWPHRPAFYRARALAHRRNRDSAEAALESASYSSNGDYGAAIRDYVEARSCESRVKAREARLTEAYKWWRTCDF